MGTRIDPGHLTTIVVKVVNDATGQASLKAKYAARKAAEAGQKAFYDRIMTSALPHSKNPPGRVKTGAMRDAAKNFRVLEDSKEHYHLAVGWASPADRARYFKHQEEGTKTVKAMGALPLAAAKIEEVLAREVR